jgi:hypothetical protein
MLKESASYSDGYGCDSPLALPRPNPIWDNSPLQRTATTMQHTLFGKHATFAT